MKVKAVCTHCGRKQTAIEKNLSLEYVPCRYCGKTGVLVDPEFVKEYNNNRKDPE